MHNFKGNCGFDYNMGCVFYNYNIFSYDYIIYYNIILTGSVGRYWIGNQREESMYVGDSG